MTMNTFGDGIRLAWGTLTALPGPAPTRVDRGVARVAMSIGWLVVLPVMVAVAAAGWGLVLLGVPSLAAGFVVVGLLQLATRSIHADGLADTADGLGSGRPKEQALEIMRRGDVGPMGVVAVVLVYGLQAVLIGDLLARPWGWVMAALALAVGRLALATACSDVVPPAREDGLGQSVARSVPAWQATALSALAAFLGVVVVDVLASTAGGDVTRAAWMWGYILGLVLPGVVLAWAIRKLGGVTGDVLGAMVELMALGMLLGLSFR